MFRKLILISVTSLIVVMSVCSTATSKQDHGIIIGAIAGGLQLRGNVMELQAKRCWRKAVAQAEVIVGRKKIRLS